MPPLRLESLSSFGRLAVKLDEHFMEWTRLSGQIERLDIESESGLERAVKALNEFAEHGEGISEGIQGLSKVLEEARARSEAAAQVVSERAQLICQRKLQQNQVRERLSQVEEKVKAANADLAGMRRGAKSEYANEERLQMRAKLARLNGDLKKLLGDVQAIKEAAGQAKFKTIERDAKNLLDALRASCQKIDASIG